MKLFQRHQKLTILILTFWAFWLRAYRLDFQSYWIDEAWTVYFTQISWAELWHLLQTSEIMPPLYHPLTIYWVQWFGDSEYALRYLSMICSVLAIPLSYRMGKAMGDDRLGLIAALLMTVAPYQIWHAQEARMYSMLSAASVMSMWGFIQLWQQSNIQNWTNFQSWRWWLIYIIGTEWAISTHYHGAVLFGIQGLFLLLTWRRHWRVYPIWGMSMILILLIQLPWLIFGGNLLQNYVNWIEQPTLWESFVRSATTYSLNKLVPSSQAVWPTLIFVISYGLGLIYAARRRWGNWHGSEMLALLLAYTIAPNVAAWLYGELKTTAYLERYMIFVQPGYLLTIAIGVLAIADWKFPRTIFHSFPKLLATVLLISLVSINGWVLYHHYYDPLYAKPDWRTVAQTIEQFSLPDDAILLTGDGGQHAFNFYYEGDLPLYLDFMASPHRVVPRKSEEEAIQLLDQMTRQHRRLWYSPYGMYLDPVLEGWLAENSYPAWHRWLGRKRLILYHGQTDTLNQKDILNYTFESGPTLIQVARPQDPIAAGDLLPLELTWQTETSLNEDYQLSLRLVNQHDDIFAQSDWPPLTATNPTSNWPPNQAVTDRRSLWLPPDIPPDSYSLQFVVYHPASGQPIGQPTILPNVAVGPSQITPSLSALPRPNSTYQPMGDLTLVGYVLQETVRPGETMWLWLYWQAQKTPPAETKLTLSLVSKEDTSHHTIPLSELTGPLESWQPEQVRRAIYHLSTSRYLSGEQAELKVALQLPDKSISPQITLADITLQTRPHNFELPRPDHLTNLTFGVPPQIKLIGYDLPTTTFKPDDTLPITLYWQAEQEIETNYTIFVQLLNDSDQVVVQVDSYPLAGEAPTTTWLPDEVLTDSYSLPLPDSLPLGTYRLIVGFYDANTGERLPLSDGQQAVELPTITLK